MLSIERSSAKRQSAASILSALIVTGLLVLLISRSHALRAQLSTVPPQPPAPVSIDHSTPLTVSIIIGNRDGKSLVAIGQSSSAAVSFTLPAGWTLHEVRHATVAETKNGPDDHGLRTWSVPRGATVTFETKTRVETLRITNPSKVPLHIHCTRLDLDTGKRGEADLLMKDDSVTVP